MSNGINSEELLKFARKWYEKKNDSQIKAFFPNLILTKTINETQWDILENEIKKSDVFENLKKGETDLIDLTEMKTDRDSLQKCSNVIKPTKDWDEVGYINEARETQLTYLSTFLQKKCDKNEIRILCIMGHGINECKARLLRENPPDSENKSTQWKWPLHDYTDWIGSNCSAIKVFQNARKGDIAVFHAGTPYSRVDN